MALLEARNLTKSYPRSGGWPGGGDGGVRVVDGVSFQIERGETLGLVGESGSGKSTVARMALGLIPPTSGSIVFDGQPVTGASRATMRRLRRRMQPVFQDPYAALNPRMRVEEIIGEPFRIYRDDPNLPRGRAAIALHVRQLLDAVGLEHTALRRYPHEFSGGQRQRINIARALALRPELLVLDEPVSALDVSVGAQVVNLLRQLQQEYRLTCLFISHSMPLVRYLATRVAVMQSGKLVETGECEAVCREPKEAYTRALLDATPSLPG